MAKNIQRDPLTYIDRTEGCWYWTGTLNAQGYGCARNPHRLAYMPAHRRIYELLVGPIPEGMTLDHECHNQDDTCPGGKDCFHRSCVRPDHLIPRSAGDNAVRSHRHNAAKTHCPRGHHYDERNTAHQNGHHRRCRRCHADQQLEWRARWASSR